MTWFKLMLSVTREWNAKLSRRKVLFLYFSEDFETVPTFRDLTSQRRVMLKWTFSNEHCSHDASLIRIAALRVHPNAATVQAVIL